MKKLLEQSKVVIESMLSVDKLYSEGFIPKTLRNEVFNLGVIVLKEAIKEIEDATTKSSKESS